MIVPVLLIVLGGIGLLINAILATANKTVQTEDIPEVEPDNTPIYQQIDFYKSRLDMLEDLQNLVSNDLRNMTKRDSRYQAKLNKLISLDNQIHTTQNKIDKLEKLLE
jgi:hypothetical protein